MSVPATPVYPPAIVVSEGSHAHAGFRWREGATLRLPSGEYVHVRSAGERELAAAVLDDRLVGSAPDSLVELRPRLGRPACARQFVWPVTAIDEWLATSGTPVAAPPPMRARSTHRRVHAIARHLLAAPLLPADSTPSPRGGH